MGAEGDKPGPWAHLLGGGTWLVAAILGSAIAFLVPAYLNDWFGIGGKNAPSREEGTAAPREARENLPFPRSRLIDSERIGLNSFEVNGTLEGALDAFGLGDARRRSGPSCTMSWKDEGLEIAFYNLGANDPCLYGYFCSAHISGREWATTRGLQIGEPVRRMWRL